MKYIGMQILPFLVGGSILINNSEYNGRSEAFSYSSSSRIIRSTTGISNINSVSTQLGVASSSSSSRLTEERKSNSIDCPHFQDGKCPGCVVDKKVGDVEIVRSAKLYFSSSSIRKYRTSNNNKRNNKTSKDYNEDDYYDDDYGDDLEDDEFYNVVVPSPLTQWRTQAKLAVTRKSSWGRDGCIFGLYERGSHKVMPIPECAVHHPSINRAVAVLTEATAKVGTPAFNEEDNNGGGLRYIQVQVERMTGRVCLTLIWHAENLKGAQPALSRLVKQIRKLDPQLWHSVWCHTNDSFGNTIFSRNQNSWHPINGPEFVREPLPGTDINKKEGLIFFTPTAFRQGNMDGFEAIAQHVANAVPGGSKVCELYAGVGILGLTALNYHAKKSDDWFNDDNDDEEESNQPLQWLRCSDENPANPRCFERTVNSMPSEITGRTNFRSKNKNYKRKGNYNKKDKNKRGGVSSKNSNISNGDLTMKELMQSMMENEDTDSFSNNDLGAKGKAKYMVASATKALYEGQALGANVLIVDPPRKGLEDEVLKQLCKPHNPNQDYVEDPVLLQGLMPNYAINWTNDVETIIYVSCGFDALARDCDKLLTANAGWELESSTGYILFPGTNHVETVAIFQRKLYNE